MVRSIVTNAHNIPPKNNTVLPISDNRAGHIIHQRIENRTNPAVITGATENTLGGPEQLYSKTRTPLSYAQKSILLANPKAPTTLQKPLMPNILDMEALEHEKKLADQRRKSGYTWRVVVQR
mgnify:CR=1 FL=1